MTVETTKRRIQHTAVGGQTVFPYDFLVYDEEHMNVYVNGVLTVDWTIDGLGVNAGGNVTLGTAPGDGINVLLERFVPALQLSDYVEYDRFPAETNEKDHDLSAMRDAQYAEQLDFVSKGGVPIGGIIPYTSATPPEGFLLCDGAVYDAVANVQYQPLYDVIGNTYGGTDNSNFAVPDLRGRAVVGVGQADTKDWLLAEEDGVDTIRLSDGSDLTTGTGPGTIANDLNNIQPSLGLNWCICYDEDVAGTQPGGLGEPNTSSTPSPVGANEADINMPKAGFDLPKRKLVGGQNVTLTQGADFITISSAAGGGAGTGDVQQTQGGRVGSDGVIAFWGEVNGWGGKNIDGDSTNTPIEFYSGSLSYHIDNILLGTDAQTITGTKTFDRSKGPVPAQGTHVKFEDNSDNVFLTMWPDYELTKPGHNQGDLARWIIRAKPIATPDNQTGQLEIAPVDDTLQKSPLERSGLTITHESGGPVRIFHNLAVGGSNYDGFFGLIPNHAAISEAGWYDYDPAEPLVAKRVYSPINPPPGGGGGHTIQDDSTPLAQRANLNFRNYFALTDDSGNDATIVDLGAEVMLKTDYDTTDDGVVDGAESLQIVATNLTGSSLSPGDLVVFDSDANITSLANASTNEWALAMVTDATILNGATGRITLTGLSVEIDTSGFAVGDLLYLSDAGAFTTTPAGDTIQPIGQVLRVNATTGVIYTDIESPQPKIPDLATGILYNSDGDDLSHSNTSTTLWTEIIPTIAPNVVGDNVVIGTNNGRLRLDYSGAAVPPAASSVTGSLVIHASTQLTSSSDTLDFTVGVNGSQPEPGIHATIQAGSGGQGAGVYIPVTLVYPVRGASDGDEFSIFTRGTVTSFPVETISVQFIGSGGGSGGAGGGVTVHNDLTGRSAVGAHPATAITNDDTGGVIGANVQAGLDFLQANKANIKTPIAIVDGNLVAWDNVNGELVDATAAIADFALVGHTHPDASGVASGFMSAADFTKLSGVEDNANAYTHPNHTGDVTSTGDGAQVIVTNIVDNTKLAQVPEYSLKGRAVALTGDAQDLQDQNITTGTPGAGDFAVGFLSSGELRKFDVGAFLGGGGTLTTVRQDSGADISTGRSRLNFIEGANISLTISDDAIDNEVDITIDAAAVGGDVFRGDGANNRVMVWQDYAGGVAGDGGANFVDITQVARRNQVNTFTEATTFRDELRIYNGATKRGFVTANPVLTIIGSNDDGVTVNQPITLQSTDLNLQTSNGAVVDQVATPTLTPQGAGTLNAAGLFINGSPVSAGGGSLTTVRQNSGANISTGRSRLNFIEGAGVTLTITDDVGNDEVDIQIDAAAGGGDVLQGTGGATGEVAVWENFAGKSINGTGIAATDVVTAAAALTSGNLTTGNGSKGIAASSVAVTNVVTAAAALTTAQLVSGDGSKGLSGNGIAAANVAQASANLTTDQLVLGAANNRTLKESGFGVSDVARFSQAADFLVSLAEAGESVTYPSDNVQSGGTVTPVLGAGNSPRIIATTTGLLTINPPASGVGSVELLIAPSVTTVSVGAFTATLGSTPAESQYRVAYVTRRSNGDTIFAWGPE